MSTGSEELTIVGAGLVGSLLATILQTKGYRVTVYERWGDIRNVPPAGRSINLVGTARGLRALRHLPPKVKEELLQLGTRVTGRIIHTDDGERIFQRYGKDDSEFNYSLSRYELNKFLINKAEEAGVRFHFGARVVGCDVSGEHAVLKTVDEAGAEKLVPCAGPVIASDGGGSGVRYSLRDQKLCEFTEDMLGSGYKEMTFPKEPAAAGEMALHGLHIWPRGKHMLMGLANLDGSFTGTIYLDTKGGDDSFEAIEAGGEAAAAAFLTQHYATALPLLGGVDAAAAQLVKNARGILGTVRTSSWAVGGKVCLLGDAAHAIVPFFGQGMNAGFEDARDLTNLLLRHAPPGGAKDYAAAFAEFGAARRVNTDAIADMALENYVEMRASTADPTFRLKKARAVEPSPPAPAQTRALPLPPTLALCLHTHPDPDR